MLDRETLDRLFQYCMVLCQDRDHAYDLVQSTVERYLDRAPPGVEQPPAYLRGIARNLFYDQQRRARVVSFEPFTPSDEQPNPERSLEAIVIDSQLLEQAWSRLTAPERETLYFWAVEGMTASEIGLHLGQPRGSVLSRLSRLRGRLQSLNPQTVSGGAHE